MQLLIILFFLIIWLLILWIGSIFLEATGLERATARFQALSALTGAGFTTTQSELIVEHQIRRKIISYLILLGNTGIMALILIVILYSRVGVSAASNLTVGAITIFMIIICCSLRLGIINSLTDKLVLSIKKKNQGNTFSRAIILKHLGEHVLASITIGQHPKSVNLTLADIRSDYNIVNLLAIERDNQVLLNFSEDEKLLINDQLLCYLRKDSQD